MKRKHMVARGGGGAGLRGLDRGGAGPEHRDSLISLSYLNDTYIPTWWPRDQGGGRKADPGPIRRPARSWTR